MRTSRQRTGSGCPGIWRAALRGARFGAIVAAILGAILLTLCLLIAAFKAVPFTTADAAASGDGTLKTICSSVGGLAVAIGWGALAGAFVAAGSTLAFHRRSTRREHTSRR